MKPLRFFPALFLLSLGLTVSAQTTAFQISGSIKTENRNKSDSQQLPRASTRLITEEKVLEMSIRRINPTLGEHAKVEWVVLLEDMRGAVRVATSGSQMLHSNVGVPVEVVSDTFTLKERTFNGEGNRGNGSVEQSVKGYAVRITDEEGRELGTKFQPSSIEKDVRSLMAKETEIPDVNPDQGEKVRRRKIPRNLR